MRVLQQIVCKTSRTCTNIFSTANQLFYNSVTQSINWDFFFLAGELRQMNHFYSVSVYEIQKDRYLPKNSKNSFVKVLAVSQSGRNSVSSVSHDNVCRYFRNTEVFKVWYLKKKTTTFEISRWLWSFPFGVCVWSLFWHAWKTPHFSRDTQIRRTAVNLTTVIKLRSC